MVLCPRFIVNQMLHAAQVAAGEEVSGYIFWDNQQKWHCFCVGDTFDVLLQHCREQKIPKNQQWLALFHAPKTQQITADRDDGIAAPSPPTALLKTSEAPDTYLQIRRQTKGVLEIFAFVRGKETFEPQWLELSEIVGH